MAGNDLPFSVTILGAGFGGLELSTMLSEALGDEVEVTLIDQADSFIFGFSKLDVMFGHAAAGRGAAALQRHREAGRECPARNGHRDRPRDAAGHHRRRRRTTPTSWSSRSAPTTTSTPRRAWPRPATSSTPSPAPNGLAEIIPTFSSGPRDHRRLRRPLQVPAGAERMRAAAPRRARSRGVRDACEITFVIPLPSPGPAVAGDLGGPDRRVRRARHQVDPRPPRRRRSTPAGSVASLDDGSELPYDLFLGVPKHRAPAGRDRQRHDRGRLGPGRPAHARDRVTPASTRSATSPPPACRRPACSPKAPRGSSRRR